MNDPELMKFMAHIDQTRATLWEGLKTIEKDDAREIIRTCAKGELSSFDESVALMVGLLAIVGLLGLIERFKGDSWFEDDECSVRWPGAGLPALRRGRRRRADLDR